MRLKAWQFYLGGVVSSLLTIVSSLALWDLARHQVELRTGFYDFPFGYRVPWWFAGDLFVFLSFLGLIINVMMVVADEEVAKDL